MKVYFHSIENQYNIFFLYINPHKIPINIYLLSTLIDLLINFTNPFMGT